MAAVPRPCQRRSCWGSMIVRSALADRGERARGARQRPRSAAVGVACSRPAVARRAVASGVLVDVVHFFRDVHADELGGRAAAARGRRACRAELERAQSARRGERRVCDDCSACTEALAPKSIGASVVTARLVGPIARAPRRPRRGRRRHAPDMAVVAWGGAVGRVVSVERIRAVRLLADPNSGAAGVMHAQPRGGDDRGSRRPTRWRWSTFPSTPTSSSGTASSPRARRGVSARVRDRSRHRRRGAGGREQVDPTSSREVDDRVASRTC